MANEKIVKARQRQKTDTTENWSKASNFVPLKGEIIVYQEENQETKLKIGDGVNTLDALDFVSGNGGMELKDGAIYQNGQEITIPIQSLPTKLIIEEELEELIGDSFDKKLKWSEIKERPGVEVGTGKNSIKFGEDSLANGDYSISGGTNDKELIKEIIGGTGILGDLIISAEDIEAPTAEAAMSMSFGAGTKSMAIGSMAIGLNAITGCKGYYWQNFTQNSDGTYTIQLSTTQPELKTSYSMNSITSYTLTYYLSDPTPPTSIPWEVGDEISIRNTQEYAFCSKITAIDATNGTITVDNLPFTENTYVPAPFTGGLSVILEMIKNLANTFYPFDLTIKVPSKPTSGVVDCSWVSFAHGYNNNSTGMVSSTFGMNNIADGQASFVTGGGNKGGHMALVGGRYNVANGDASFAAGYKNNATGMFSSATGSNTTAEGAYSSSEGYGTTARYTGSHVEGRETLDGDEFQHVHGKWNDPTWGPWVVGNGISDQNRSNAAYMDWNGNVKFAGDVQGHYNGESVGLGYTWDALKQARTDLTTVYNRVGNTPVADQISNSLKGYSTPASVSQQISESLKDFSKDFSKDLATKPLDKLYASDEAELNGSLSSLLEQMEDGSVRTFEVLPKIYVNEDFSDFADENTIIDNEPTTSNADIKWNGATPSSNWSATLMAGSVILQPHVEEDGNVCIKMTPRDTGRMQVMYRIPEDIYNSLVDGGKYKVSVRYKGEGNDFNAQMEAKAASTWSVVPVSLINGEWVTAEHEFAVDKSFGSLTLTFGIAWPGGSTGSMTIDNIALERIGSAELFDGESAIGRLYRADNSNALARFDVFGSAGSCMCAKTLYGGTWQPLEWENPPYKFNKVYRTMERYNSLPVYAVNIACGMAVHGETQVTLSAGIVGDPEFEACHNEWTVVGYEGSMYDAFYSGYPDGNWTDKVGEYPLWSAFSSIKAMWSANGLTLNFSYKDSHFANTMEGDTSITVKFIKKETY